MVVNPKTKTYLIRLLFVAIILGLFIILVYIPYFTPGPYGSVSVSIVTESEARSGILVHTNETDLTDLPVLSQLLLQNRPGGADLNKNEWDICGSKCGNWIGNKTRYIEYQGKYYHVSCYVV